MKNLKSIVKEYKGVIAFYILIVISALLITARFNYLNELENNNYNNNTVAIINN